ncbi:MAG: 16S rRNA (adenine(1518)-N(6)/adenine(1519)-N(6))-dimethyltransferase RsmA [bacterium]|nr:16S rRNA (adenine(1518)-N(6)/adenine(1519)-N(6))-dimethyltransferase RsmA [bacterium]
MSQKLGQHFLKDKSVLKKIATSLEIKKGDTIIEIGPGHGELTELIAKELIAFSRKLILIEKDKELIPSLRKKFTNTNTFIIEDDILKVLQQLVIDYKLQAISYKLTGNIPYYITGQLLRIISELKSKPELCVFTIQKEVAERIVAKPPKANLLACAVQIWANPKIIATIPAGAFNPPPKVTSAIIKLETKKEILDEKLLINYFKMLHILFKQPRKTILNNLSEGLNINKAGIIAKLEKLGINPKNRPQNLEINDIIALSEIFIG